MLRPFVIWGYVFSSYENETWIPSIDLDETEVWMIMFIVALIMKYCCFFPREDGAGFALCLLGLEALDYKGRWEGGRTEE